MGKRANKSIEFTTTDIKGMIRSAEAKKAGRKVGGRAGKVPTRMTARAAAYLAVVAKRFGIAFVLDALKLADDNDRIILCEKNLRLAQEIGKTGNVMPEEHSGRRATASKKSSASAAIARKTEDDGDDNDGEVEATE